MKTPSVPAWGRALQLGTAGMKPTLGNDMRGGFHRHHPDLRFQRSMQASASISPLCLLPSGPNCLGIPIWALPLLGFCDLMAVSLTLGSYKMRSLHWLIPMGLPALPLCEFCKHKIICSLSTTCLANKRGSPPPTSVGWSIAWMDVGPLKQELPCMPALIVPWFIPKLKPASCQTSGRSPH